ncbi:MAG: hypothetical protein IPK96_19350 [Flammeovirgaceae bacterium]|nr:hypothetical protein [Flammeovirgaceae bacterium]
MKKVIGMILCGMILISCQENETTSEFTGNESTYALQPGSQYNTSGTVTIKERRDGTSTLLVTLSGTSGNNKLPLHLHLGDLATPGADVAALLNPVDSKTGMSETILTQLADETIISYADLIQLEACVKVHLSDTGPERDIILAGGNIGLSVAKAISSGRIGVEACKSE